MENRVETATTPIFRATTERRRAGHAGFTLIEIVVVVAIIAIAAAIAVPSIGAGAHQRQVRGTLQGFVSAIRRASSVAVFQRRPVELKISTDDASYSIVAQKGAVPHTVKLPEIASFGDVEGGRDLGEEGIVFDFLPNGSSSGGTVELLFQSSRGRPESFKLVINPLISAVSFEEDK
jgi:type II secretion system protein H